MLRNLYCKGPHSTVVICYFNFLVSINISDGINKDRSPTQAKSKKSQIISPLWIIVLSKRSFSSKLPVLQVEAALTISTQWCQLIKVWSISHSKHQYDIKVWHIAESLLDSRLSYHAHIWNNQCDLFAFVKVHWLLSASFLLLSRLRLKILADNFKNFSELSFNTKNSSVETFVLTCWHWLTFSFIQTTFHTTCLFTRLESLAWSQQGFWQPSFCRKRNLWNL